MERTGRPEGFDIPGMEGKEALSDYPLPSKTPPSFLRVIKLY